MSSITFKGTFKNNIGKYGSFICIGFIDRKSNGEINKLENICESTDQNGIKQWSKGRRSKSDIKAELEIILLLIVLVNIKKFS